MWMLGPVFYMDVGLGFYMDVVGPGFYMDAGPAF